MKINKSLINKLERARKYHEESTRLMDEFIFEIQKMLGVESLEDVRCDGASSDNLLEVISCHVSYGEFDIDAIYKTVNEWERKELTK